MIMKIMMMIKITLPSPLANKQTSFMLYPNINSIQKCLLNKTSQVIKNNHFNLINLHNLHLQNLKTKVKFSKISSLTNLSSKLINSKSSIIFHQNIKIKLKNCTQKNLAKK